MEYLEASLYSEGIIYESVIVYANTAVTDLSLIIVNLFSMKIFYYVIFEGIRQPTRTK